MSKNLVIVESPAKAKTIEKFLGNDFRVLSSQGHIRDIAGTKGNRMGIDFEHGYTPHYVIDSAKHTLVATLKSEAQKADEIWLASDEDREGEAIAWHLKEVLDLPKEKTQRIVFHEITQTAIQNAIQNPRDIDYNLVDAQQARRVLDRIVGYELSPILWAKVAANSSAGRVQSVAVRLIVDRERKINAFVPTAQYRVLAAFEGQDAQGQAFVLHTELNHRFDTKAEALAFLEQCKGLSFAVEDITKTPVTRMPAPPFTTSTLQQEAAQKLYFPVSKTMRIAQSLYEAGKITYMRTDSVNLSTLAINTTKEEILKDFGAPYSKPRHFHTTAKGAQEAHEAIRPTYVNVQKAGATADEQKLYNLIWKRTVASQMAEAQLENTHIKITAQGTPYAFLATGQVVLFDGFMKVYTQSADEEAEANSTLLPSLPLGTSLIYQSVVAQEAFEKGPARYSEASLVKEMETMGIGRPSTYATIIDTIQKRNYVARGDGEGKKRNLTVLTLSGKKITEKAKSETYGADKGRLVPTDLGTVVTDFLVQNFATILDYEFTAKIEKEFDHIAAGEMGWSQMVDRFYQDFHPTVESVPTGKIGGRQLGIDPKTNRPVLARVKSTGSYIQIGLATDEDKPLFASLKKGQSVDTITLEEALELFNTPFPYVLGQYEGADLVVNTGRFGPYIKQNNDFFSIPKTLDAEHLSMEDAIEIIEKKRQANLPLHEFGDIKVLNGRFGAYIQYQDNNYKLPKGTDASALTEQACLQIIQSTTPTPVKHKAFARKSAAKTTTTKKATPKRATAKKTTSKSAKKGA